MATTCGKGGYRNATHTGLQYGIKDLLSCAGIMARQEEYGCFQGADENSNLRPDLSIWNTPHCPINVEADIQVTCPVPVRYTNALSVREAQKPGRAADNAHNTKVRKYAEIQVRSTNEVAKCSRNGHHTGLEQVLSTSNYSVEWMNSY